MASGSFTGSTNNQYITPRIDWSSVQDIDSNNSQVTAILYIYKNSASATHGTGSWTININGNNGGTSAYKEFKTSLGWVYILSHTVTVQHADDGTKSIYIGASGGISGTSYTTTSVGQTVQLDNIPRASAVSLSAAEIDFGGSITATITPASASYTHKIKWSLGDHSSEYTLAAGVTSNTFTVPAAWMAEIPSATYANISCKVTTIKDGTELGDKTVTFRANVPASVIPTLSSLTPTGIETAWGLYIQNKSSASIAFSAAGIYGSTISAYVITGVATSVTTPITMPVFTDGKTYTLTGYVIDSRGRRSADKTTDITVYPSANPTLSASAVRCDSNGTVNADGLYIKALATYACSSVNGNNTVSCTVKFRKIGAAAWTSAGNLTSGTARTIGNSTVTTADDWEVLFTATDALSKTSEYNAKVSRSFRLLNASGTLKSVAIGRMANLQNALQVALDAYFNGNVNIDGIADIDGNANIAGNAAVTGDLTGRNITASSTIAAENLALTNAIPIAAGGTGASTADTARTNLLTALRPKKLWSGSFAGGTITVPGLSDYALVVATCASDPNIWMIGSNGTYGSIFGLYQAAGISAMYCRCSQSGNNLTIDNNFRGAGYWNGGSYPSALTGIWGLILKSDVTGGI